jgi:hypothetical protein
MSDDFLGHKPILHHKDAMCNQVE